MMIIKYQGQKNLLLIVTVKDYNDDAIIDANHYEDNLMDAKDIRLS